MLKLAFSDYAQIIQIKPGAPEWGGRDAVAELRQLIVDIRAALDDDHKHYLKDRTLDQLVRHFEKGNLAFGAVDAEGKLVGCALLSELNDQDNAPFFAEHYGVQNLAPGNWAVHTVGIHPDHTGHKLQQGLLEAVQVHTSSNPEQFVKLVAKVADSNNISRHNFLSANYIAAAQGYDRKGYDYTLYAHNVQSDLAHEAGMPFNGTDELAFHPSSFGPNSLR